MTKSKHSDIYKYMTMSQYEYDKKMMILWMLPKNSKAKDTKRNFTQEELKHRKEVMHIKYEE